MPAGIRLQGAYRPGARFPFLYLLAALLAGPALLPGQAAGATGTCRYTRVDDHARVVYVYDGDTVRLQDGRRVRLIGINTPEIGHHGATSEPLAAQARKALQLDLESGHNRVLLEYGREQHDHYGRLLAHVYLENGDNVAVPLLQQGLATTLVVPPNTRAAPCYQALENTARTRRAGLWQLPRYQPRDSARLTTDLRGFAIVRGRVQAIRHSRRSTWIDLAGPLSLHISRRDHANFPSRWLEELPGRKVEVRGWLRPQGKRLQMKVQHPAALELLSP
jgi:endonuclease YncB( thermonuclease family)